MRSLAKISFIIMLGLNFLGLPLMACESSHKKETVSHCHSMKSQQTQTSQDQITASSSCYFCQNKICLSETTITPSEQSISQSQAIPTAAFEVKLSATNTTYSYQYLKPPPLIPKNWQALYSVFLN